MSKPARKAVAAVPKRASKPRKVNPPEAVNLGPAAPEPFMFRYDPEAKTPLHGCPFVARTSESAPLCFWAVPATGGYDPGWRIGTIMSHFYLRAISAKNGGLGLSGSWLSHILIELFDRIAEEAKATAGPLTENDAYYSLRGQLLGFLETIEHAAAYGAYSNPSAFTSFDADKALRLAEMGLTFDEKKWARLMRRKCRVQDEMDALPGAELMKLDRLAMLRE